jgi:hypothetical protein
LSSEKTLQICNLTATLGMDKRDYQRRRDAMQIQITKIELNIRKDDWVFPVTVELGSYGEETKIRFQNPVELVTEDTLKAMNKIFEWLEDNSLIDE